jgi:hypothetical protein
MFTAAGLNWRARILGAIGRSCLLSVLWTNLRFHRPQACLAHQAANFEPTDTDAAIRQRCH